MARNVIFDENSFLVSSQRRYVFMALLRVSRLRVSADPQVLNFFFWFLLKVQSQTDLQVKTV